MQDDLQKTVTYGTETWVGNERMDWKLEVTVMEFCQRSQGLTRADGVINKDAVKPLETYHSELHLEVFVRDVVFL